MKNILRYEVKWHENHLTLLCLIAFGLPYLFYLASVILIVINWNKGLNDMHVGDAAGIAGGFGAGSFLKRKFKFKN